MQLRSRCASGLRVAGGSRLPSRAGRRAVQAHATAKQPKADVRAARMARILRQYEAADVDKQQEELSAYVDERESRRGDPEEEGSTRALRASAGYRATDERDQARMDQYLPLQADGTRLHNAGLHGNGQDCWWAIRIKAGREKQVCEAVERMPGILEPLAPKEEGGEPRPRILQTWAPRKSQKVWNPKTGKMGNKVLKYPSRYPEMLMSNTNGGMVFVRAEMDKALFDRLSMNPSFIAFDQVETFNTWDATGMPTAWLYPKPATPKQLAEAKEWEADLEPVEEGVVRKVLDLPVPRPAAPSWEEREDSPRGRRGRDDRDGGRFEGRRERPEGRGRFDRGEGRGRSEDGGERRGRWFDAAAEPAEGGNWHEGGRSGSTRERQGTGLYSAADGGQRAPWQERGGERRERRDRDGGGWEDRRRGGREGGSWEDRRGGREGGSWEDRRGGREGGSWEDRRGGREGGSWEDRPRRERREDGGGRWGDDRSGRQQGRWEDRRRGDQEQPAGRGRDGWRDRAAEPARGGSWYDGGASSANSSSEDEAAGTAGGWFDASSPSEGSASEGQGAFSSWFDSAAAAFDFEAGGGAGAAASDSAPAGEPAASGSGWDWEAAMQPQQPAAGGAPPAQSSPAADAAGVWDQPAAGLDPWGAADVAAFGVPVQQGERRGQYERRGPREDRGRRSFDEGDRRGGRRDRDGGSRFGDREGGSSFGDRGAGGRFGDREGGRFGDRGAGGRFGDRERRGGREGGWEGRRERREDFRDSPAPTRSADLSWWDNDGQQDGDQFAGVFTPGSDWQPPSQDEEGGSGQERGSGRGRSRGGDSWRGESGEGSSDSGSGSSSGAAAAAFQPGQEIAVVGGSFADFGGKVVASDGGRVTAELDIFGKKTRVELSPTDVAPSSGGSGSGAAPGGSEDLPAVMALLLLALRRLNEFLGRHGVAEAPMEGLLSAVDSVNALTPQTKALGAVEREDVFSFASNLADAQDEHAAELSASAETAVRLHANGCRLLHRWAAAGPLLQVLGTGVYHACMAAMELLWFVKQLGGMGVPQRMAALMAAQWEAMQQLVSGRPPAETLEGVQWAAETAWLAAFAPAWLHILQPQLAEQLAVAIHQAVHHINERNAPMLADAFEQILFDCRRKERAVATLCETDMFAQNAVLFSLPGVAGSQACKAAAWDMELLLTLLPVTMDAVLSALRAVNEAVRQGRADSGPLDELVAAFNALLASTEPETLAAGQRRSLSRELDKSGETAEWLRMLTFALMDMCVNSTSLARLTSNFEVELLRMMRCHASLCKVLRRHNLGGFPAATPQHAAMLQLVVRQLAEHSLPAAVAALETAAATGQTPPGLQFPLSTLWKLAGDAASVLVSSGGQAATHEYLRQQRPALSQLARRLVAVLPLTCDEQNSEQALGTAWRQAGFLLRATALAVMTEQLLILAQPEGQGACPRLDALLAAQWEAMERCRLLPPTALAWEARCPHMRVSELALVAAPAAPWFLTVHPQLLEQLTASVKLLLPASERPAPTLASTVETVWSCCRLNVRAAAGLLDTDLFKQSMELANMSTVSTDQACHIANWKLDQLIAAFNALAVSTDPAALPAGRRASLARELEQSGQLLLAEDGQLQALLPAASLIAARVISEGKLLKLMHCHASLCKALTLHHLGTPPAAAAQRTALPPLVFQQLAEHSLPAAVAALESAAATGQTPPGMNFPFATLWNLAAAAASTLASSGTEAASQQYLQQQRPVLLQLVRRLMSALPIACSEEGSEPALGSAWRQATFLLAASASAIPPEKQPAAAAGPTYRHRYKLAAAEG
ncbi:DEAD DEAH box helicase [Chlorella sorokiniana]|uniref:DEAD DEAH box helicase n=1 Tax=Chlorella sorokiniana TaxID=3076 RepID=A0A2P6TUW8_CHLSO|nr:DEAD DEAH box helicase [Chlorella sorokiniana]|eukprot:PRW57863.1 DEAD DEAH box helicase [Chlorella sorokiniana]